VPSRQEVSTQARTYLFLTTCVVHQVSIIELLTLDTKYVFYAHANVRQGKVCIRAKWPISLDSSNTKRLEVFYSTLANKSKAQLNYKITVGILFY